MRIRRVFVALTVAVVVSILFLSIYQTGQHENILRVTTTTSLYNTGLLDKLAEEFKQMHPDVSVQFIAIGSGEALRRAAQGDADMVLSHAPNLEKRYLDDGTLKPGKIFAYNYFIIVGPSDDPANVTGMSPIEAMAAIYTAGERGRAIFVSRADNSGTHNREANVTAVHSVNPSGKTWYLELGADMALTLMVANEKKAYTLSDVGTYLKFSDKLGELKPLVERGDALINIYSVYVVNPVKVPGVNEKLAEVFMRFITSEEGQKIIENYGIDEFGKPLFNAARGDPTGELKNVWESMAKLG